MSLTTKSHNSHLEDRISRTHISTLEIKIGYDGIIYIEINERKKNEMKKKSK